MDNASPDVNTSISPPNMVWTFGGYQLEAGNFATALVHFYRAEVTRANAWRARLDVTTNWAVVSVGAAISFAFAQTESHHSVIILLNLLVTLFLFIEARRYRYYELWSYRIRLIETDFYAAMLVPPFRPREDWSRNLAGSLLYPQFPISVREAVGRRLRRNYMWIYLVLALAWVGKLLLYPDDAGTLYRVVTHASMGAIPGELVWLGQITFYLAVIAVGLGTRNLQQTSGEVIHRPVEDITRLKEDVKTGDIPSYRGD